MPVCRSRYYGVAVPITLCDTDTNAFPFTVDSARQCSAHSQWHILGPKMICPFAAALTLVPAAQTGLKQSCPPPPVPLPPPQLLKEGFLLWL